MSTKLLGFVGGGSTALSVNLPEVMPPNPPGAYRMGYLHSSEPGVLAGLNKLLADSGANVIGQALSTRGEQGYVVTDTDKPLAEHVLTELNRAPQTLWLRFWEPQV